MNGTIMRTLRASTALLSALTVLAIVLGSTPFAAAADWPTWRGDAGRTAYSQEDLSSELHLQWMRQFPAYDMAWPNESRLHFDTSYEPVVLGSLLFVGSAVDGSVRALETDTGQQRWSFYTEGPVRFAPTASRGNIYVGSDDGYLYCLAAETGELRWKVRGAPDDRPHRRHLGNNRLVSYWPVRGGPVAADGVVYFAAGIWPTLGVFVHAVDARTGKSLWVNSTGSCLPQTRIDHNELHEVGLSPQGYLAINGDKLLVPNGRSFPARLDRKTGKLLHYVQGYRHGACRITTLGNFAFVGKDGVINVNDGREVGSRWIDAGADAPNRFDPKRFELFEGPIFPYKLFPACDASSVLTPSTVYGMHEGTVYAYDFLQPAVREYDNQYAGRTAKPWRWDLPLRWKAATPQADKKPAAAGLIRAGNRLYGYAGKTLVAMSLPANGAEPQIVWQHEIDDMPSSMLAADGKLFVVTRQGRFLCFGAKQRDAEVRPFEPQPVPARDDPWVASTAALLEATGLNDGCCLVLGLEDGRLVEELLRQSGLRIIAVDNDAKKIDSLRDRLVTTDLYGTRVTLFKGDPLEFSFPPYLASLIVSENASAVGFRPDKHVARLFEVLRPYGGTLCLNLLPEHREDLIGFVASADLPNAKPETAGNLVLVRRQGALAGSASWTHETGGSARSYFSQDQRVKAPLGVLWYGDGPTYGFYKNKDYGVGVKPQVVGGRMFAYQIQSRTLHAVDAYTGRLLWKVPVEHFTRYASMKDGVYVAGASRCQVLDPANGQPLRSHDYAIEGMESPQVTDIRVGRDTIVIAAAEEKVRAIDRGLWDAEAIVALDRKTGEQLWQRKATHRFNCSGLAVADEVVYCIDSVSPTWTAASGRRGNDAQPKLATVLALDARTGSVKWHAETTNDFREYATASSWLSVRTKDDWLAVARESGLLLVGRHNQVRAFDAKTGNPEWQQTIGGGQPVIVAADRFINQAGHVYMLKTGELLDGKALFVRGGCNYAVAGEHLLFVRDRCVSYVDLATREKHFLRNVRSGCSNSLVAADGLLNAPCFSVRCVCNYPIQTSFAMTHMPEVAAWDSGNDQQSEK